MNDKKIECLENKKLEMENCQHLFLKLEEGQRYYGFHSSDCGYDPCVVVCLKCGLTNKYIERDSIYKEYNTILGWRNPYYDWFVETNDKIFRKQFGHAWRRGGKSFDDSVFNLISDEAWYVDRPMLLYSIAKIIKPEADNTELFDTMKSLYELETPIERQKIDKIEKAQELIDRYKKEKVKVLKCEE